MAFALYEKWKNYKDSLTMEFYSHISGLLEHEQVMELDNFIQHYCYTRLKHSLDVSYYSFIITRILHWDSRSAARGGLLHDLFFYDWRDDDYICTGKSHASEHPKIALENAKRICELNLVEEDIILKHMWLVTIAPPSYKESYVVTFVDKACATRELIISLFSRTKKPRAVCANNI